MLCCFPEKPTRPRLTATAEGVRVRGSIFKSCAVQPFSKAPHNKPIAAFLHRAAQKKFFGRRLAVYVMLALTRTPAEEAARQVLMRTAKLVKSVSCKQLLVKFGRLLVLQEPEPRP